MSFAVQVGPAIVRNLGLDFVFVALFLCFLLVDFSPLYKCSVHYVTAKDCLQFQPMILLEVNHLLLQSTLSR